ncbi:hypothetical protein I3760_13G122400 [Carya illinoinensis]|nr:hypothetical protein I3760_13G122400 [Carya illinoinensis]KAG2674174.1 hypothetical protein I3760_13G122400 [Carya illinoinensis]KAG2674175.1 hypothetical protein I3760_13G122400 [Carya illinoinensis]KAG2674176.1 hypothetical protein I3760_13G122400 [Carya illinoinensis]
MDGSLDFEFEDPLLSSPVVTKKRKKVIGLDDLLSDYYKEKSKLVERESIQEKAQKAYNSDDDVNTKEASLSEVIDQCQNQMREISGEEDMSTWGMHVFGNQKVPPPLAFPGLGSCAILQSFMNNELNSLFELDSDKGDLFLEGLLANGWLSKLAFICGCVEKSMAMWTFNLMLYSPKEELRTSACEFWCAILSSKDEPVLIDWLPSYFELKGALEIYGFQSKSSFNRDSLHAGSNYGGPPQNIRSWIRFAAACSHVRNKFSVLSTSEAEELVEVIIFLFLDLQLHGLAVLLYECMQSLISYFTEKEWKNSCNKIAKSLACRVPKDLNCLRAVECISGYDTRSKQLRSSVAYQILLVCFDNKATDEEEVMRLLIAINVKEKGCDLFKMYIYLVLAENWLLVNQMLEHKPVINEMWGLYLRNCSCQISSTDLRSFASKVRNKASYLLQGTVTK